MPITYPDLIVEGQEERVDTVVTDDTRSVILGPTERGPAFVPTAVGDDASVERVFGSAEYQATWAAREQAREGGVPRVVRVAETSPYDPGAILIGLDDPDQALQGDLYQHQGAPSYVLAAVLLTDREDAADVDVTGTWEDLSITLVNDSGAVVGRLESSLDPGSARYLPKVVDQLDGVDLHANFVDTQVRLRGEVVLSDYVESGALDLTDQPPTRARTPWITSQDTPQAGVVRLFRFHALDEGRQSNRRVKISIRNITETEFDVVVRSLDDSDLDESVLERFEEVSLVPDSEDFIARRIGDDVEFFDGERLVSSGGSFPVQSQYVRVEMAAQFIPEGAYPWGNEGYREPVRAPAGVAVPTLPITEDQESEVPFVDLGSRRRLIHLGADLSSTQATAFLNPIPSGADTQQPFSVSQGDIETTEPGTRRFTVGLQGGYAGGRIYKNPLFRADVTADNQQGLDCSSFDSPGTDAYRSALLLLEDRISTRVSHVSLPGCLLSIHQAVLQEAESLCERRNDCLLTAQVAGPGTSTTDIERISGSLDGSQVALYHGWVRTGLGPAPVQDLVPQVFSLNDRLGSVATAPAGRTRGRLSPSALGLYEVYSRADRERLLSSDVNHPSRNRDRLFIVGQETRYDDRSALSHVNVRRGTNFAKLVALDAASDALFEPNTPDTVDEVEGRITDALNAVSVRGGLEGFRVSFSGEGQEITGSIALSFQDVIEEVVVDFSVLRDRIVFA